MTKLNMYKLAHKPTNYMIHNNNVAQHILQNYIQNATENTLIVLHGPAASGKSSITQKVMNDAYHGRESIIEAFYIDIDNLRDIYRITERYDNPILITIQDTVDLQNINLCYNILNELHRNKPVIILLELLTN